MQSRAMIVALAQNNATFTQTFNIGVKSNEHIDIMCINENTLTSTMLKNV